MAKRKTHDVVMHDGERWHNIGNVIRDDETGKEILWLKPHATQQLLQGRELGGKDIPCLMAPYKPRPAVQPQDKAPNPPFDNPPGGVQPKPAQYNEPPMDFDDEIPFN